MIFHVIADANGELLAWIKAAPPTESGPRVVMAPVDRTHVLHEDLEIDADIRDRASLAIALQRALTDRIRRRR
ncbi:MAG TPA: hypothetical protein VMS64_00415 [Candidatus Methylomirabilis sp.]|nr:hypothetical protein [Candidatus Methylomirabilis sp.]